MSRGTVALPSVAWYFHPMSFTATTSMARAKRVAAAVHRCRPRVRRLAVHVDVHAARRLSGARPKRVSPLTSDVAPPGPRACRNCPNPRQIKRRLMARDVQLRMLP